MHLLGDRWWLIIVAMVVAMLAYMVIASRGTEGGARSRAKAGWAQWRAVSRRAADFQARVILTILFFTVAAPFGLGRKFIGDPLRLKASSRTRGWLPRETAEPSLVDARRQY